MAEPLSAEAHRALVAALADGDWHSGARLAETFGLSRAALAKRVDALETLGLNVERRHGRGYRLPQALELLEEDRLRRDSGLARLSVCAVTDSTNADLLAAPAADDPQARLAEYQRAGRGRRGRAWVSPFGHNLMLSLAWRYDPWPRDLGALPLAIGVVTAEALAAAGLADVQLKWPNDLHAGGGKLGGILIEHRGEAGGPCRVVVGIGLNLQPLPPGAVTDQPWRDVHSLLGRPVGRNALAADLLRRLAGLLAGYAADGFAPWQAAWRQRDLTRDRAVRLEGETVRQGIARGIDAQGLLQVEIDGRLTAIHSGEVSLRWD